MKQQARFTAFIVTGWKLKQPILSSMPPIGLVQPAFPALEPGVWLLKVSLLVGLVWPFKHMWVTVAQYCYQIFSTWNEFSSFSLPSEPYPCFQVQRKSHVLSEVLPYQRISQSLYLLVICIVFIIFASQLISTLFLGFLIKYLNIYISFFT